MSKLCLDRILHAQGFGTRRECRALISKGHVRMAGIQTRNYGEEFELEGLELTVGVTEVTCKTSLYLALHKPAGYECSRKPDHHESVLSLLPPHYLVRGVQPAGRLDQDTSGLLLLSDDGAFVHRISSPKRQVSKTYLATVADPVTPELIGSLLEGVLLNGEKAPLAALACSKVDDTSLELTIGQGKYHQVKRMLAAAGTACVSLSRTAIGELSLTELNLAAGEWRELSELERTKLFSLRTSE